MEIRKASFSDYRTILTLYEKARSFMAEHNNPHQWGTSRPSKEEISSGIEQGNHYVCIAQKEVVATFFYALGQDKTYDNIYDGNWLCDSPYGVVHRITSDGSVKGAASFCLDWAFSQCGNLRIDTHNDNKIMQNLLKKNGFVYCGIIICEDGTKRLAYQKI